MVYETSRSKIRKPTVLFLEWNTSGREFDIACPLMYVFERHLGWNVEYKCQFNFLDVLRTRPSLVIMSGTTGHVSGLAWAKRFADSGILLVSHVTEGMYRAEDIEGMVYGWALSERLLPEQKCLLWSDSSLKFAIDAFPDLKTKLAVSGAVGFDKYTFLNTEKYRIESRDKEPITIGYAGFDFNHMLAATSKNKEDHEENARLVRGENRCRDYLRAMVVNNPEVSFIFKPHPRDGKTEPSECPGLESYKNFRIATDLSMFDFLAQVDMLISYNSTTTVDAWVTNIPAVILNDEEEHFSHEALSEALRLGEAADLNGYLDMIKSGASLREINKGSDIDGAIARTIGSADGMNHLRFCVGIADIITDVVTLKAPSKINVNFKFFIFSFAKTLMFYLSRYFRYLPYFGKRFLIYKRFSAAELKRNKSRYYESLDYFYSKKSKDVKIYLDELKAL